MRPITVAEAAVFAVTFTATFTALVAIGGAVVAVRAIRECVR